MNITLAIFLGFFFGFVLQKAGAASPSRIIDMLRFKDLHLMKAILLGIGLSSGILFLLLKGGFADSAHLSVKSAYIGVIAGGLLLGFGWAFAGFCPGTAIVGLGAGRKDAWFFVSGGLIGAWLYSLLYGKIASSALFADIGGKSTLAATGNAKFPVLIDQYAGELVAGGIALLFIIIAFALPLLKKRGL